MVAHAVRPRIQKAEGGDLSLRPAWFTVWVQGLCQGYTEKSCQKTGKKNLFLSQYFLLNLVTHSRSVFTSKEGNTTHKMPSADWPGLWMRQDTKESWERWLMGSPSPFTQSAGGSRWQGHHQQGLSRAEPSITPGILCKGNPSSENKF